MSIDRDKMRETVIKTVSEKIGIPLEHVCDYDGEKFVCRDARGFTYLISGYIRYGTAKSVYMVRSVGRNWRRDKGCIQTIVGGQVIQGKQLGHWAESGDNSFHIPTDVFLTPDTPCPLVG